MMFARRPGSWLLRTRNLAVLERKLVWMMGSPRSGSTWLMYLLEEPPRVAVLQEPLIGLHLGLFASYIVENGEGTLAAGLRMRDLRDDDRYFFSERHRSDWAPALRKLVLRGLAPHAPRRSRYLVVQEPNGSEGADLLMAVLPRSHLLFLLRDGRDVVDSVLDAYAPGSWLDDAFGVAQQLDGPARRRLIEREAQRWVARTEITCRAFEQHPPARRLLVRYEDLLADTPKELRSIYSWLGLTVPGDLQQRVDERAFSALPDTARGPGKFQRAATPGLWRENLAPDEQALCEKVMGPTLRTMGYEG
jgi:Sulfotransferase family